MTDTTTSTPTQSSSTTTTLKPLLPRTSGTTILSPPTKKSSTTADVLLATIFYTYSFYIFKLFKWLYRLYTNQSQIERICSSQHHATATTATIDMTQQIEESIAMSNQFRNVFITVLKDDKKNNDDDDEEEQVPLIIPAPTSSKNSNNKNIQKYILNPRLFRDFVSPDTASASSSSQDKDTILYYDPHIAHIVVNGILKVKKPSLAQQILKSQIDASNNSNNKLRVLRKDKTIPQWVHRLFTSIEHLSNVNQSIRYLTSLKEQKVVESNRGHEQMLEQLWRSAFPQWKRTKRITSEWQMLGFQGTDPLTDFRGMGSLSLHNLHYFMRECTERARSVLADSRSAALPQELEDDDRWYGFAISGINFSAELYEKALGRHALFCRRFYTSRSNEEALRIFNEVYVKFFLMFSEYFKRTNASVVQFNDRKSEMAEMFFAD